MSWQATSWALRKAPVGGNTTARLILVSLADRAGVDGRNTWPSVRTLTDELHISDSTVRRQLTWLEERGIISRGNQSMAARNAHGKVIPPQFRPVVWNLSMGVPAEQVEETEESLLEVRPVKMTGQKTVAEARPVTHADSDLSPVTDKPVILKPSPSPSDEGPPEGPGDGRGSGHHPCDRCPAHVPGAPDQPKAQRHGCCGAAGPGARGRPGACGRQVVHGPRQRRVPVPPGRVLADRADRGALP